MDGRGVALNVEAAVPYEIDVGAVGGKGEGGGDADDGGGSNGGGVK